MQSDQIDSVRSLCLCHCSSNVCCSALFVWQLHKHVHLTFLCILLLSSSVAEDQDLFELPLHKYLHLDFLRISYLSSAVACDQHVLATSCYMWLPASGCMSSFCTLLHRITLVKLAWSKDCWMHLLPASKLLFNCDFVSLCRIILVKSAWSVSCCPFPAWLAGSLFLPAHCPQYRYLCFFACYSHCVHTLAVSLANAVLDSTQLS